MSAPEAAPRRPGEAIGRIGSLFGRRRPDEVDDGPEAGTRTQRIDPYVACLIRLAQHFGHPVSEADILAVVPTEHDGMTPDGFARAADRLGFKVGPADLDATTLAHLPVPFLALYGDRPPRAVLSREGGSFVTLIPETGAVDLLVADDLADGATGALMLRPEAARQVVQRNWMTAAFERVKWVIVELLAASLVINLFALAAPLFMMTVYNKIVGQRALDTLEILALGMITIYVFDLILRTLRGYISTHTGARLDALIGSEVVHHLLRLPYRHFETTPSGMITERLRQLDTIRAFFTGQMPLTCVDLLFVAVFLAALFWISPLMGWITLGSMPLFVLLSLCFHKLQRRLNEQNFMGQAAKTSTLSETVANALTVKSLSLESEIERRWETRLGVSAWTGFRAANISNILTSVSTFLQQVVGLLIIFIGVRLIIAGDMTIGALIASNILASRAIAPMRQLVSAWNQVHEVRAAFERIDSIMSQPAESQPGTLGAAPPLKGEIEFERVGYTYSEDSPPALRAVSLEIQPGEMLGVIGPSGSGKSTMIKLLQGLYVPESGRVLIDKTDIAHISHAALRQQIGIVPQDVQLFAGSVRDNISMGAADRDPARIVAVAKFVGAHDFVQHLAKGYDTVLSERGGGLSAGQRQLLAIARALLRNPRILVLDEATSALDPATEERFMRNLKRASRGRTIVIISHRMAPVSLCDKVALMIDGRVERVGPPAEVIAFARTRMAEAVRGSDG